MKPVKRSKKKAKALGKRLDSLTPAQRLEIAKLLRAQLEEEVMRGGS